MNAKLVRLPQQAFAFDGDFSSLGLTSLELWGVGVGKLAMVPGAIHLWQDGQARVRVFGRGFGYLKHGTHRTGVWGDFDKSIVFRLPQIPTHPIVKLVSLDGVLTMPLAFTSNDVQIRSIKNAVTKSIRQPSKILYRKPSIPAPLSLATAIERFSKKH